MDRALRAALGFAALALGLAAAGPASALPVELRLYVGGQQVGYYDQSALGCSAGDVTARCTGGGLVRGDLRLDSWDMSFDNDPVVSGIVAVTNQGLSTQQFTLLFTLPVAPLATSLIGGSVQGGMTDNTGDGATVSAATGSALYTALIDGASVQALYAAPQSFSSGAFLSGNIPNTAFGTPIPSQAGPPVASSIGIRLDFLLTPGDSASFTSNFVVVVPEPGTALLFGAGLVGLGLLGSRRRT